MRLLGINLENFRNITSGSLSFDSDRVFFLGTNGQGKSNALEAIGLCSNLRSFRGANSESMVLHHADHSRLFARFEDDDGNDHDVMVRFGKKGAKSIQMDGEPIRRLGSFLGKFPSVCLSSRDLRLVRESPSDRRKWLDLFISSISSKYLFCLQRYYRGMKERNSLLKKQTDDNQILIYERIMAEAAMEIQQTRANLFPSIQSFFFDSYSNLSCQKINVSLEYAPNVQANSAAEWENILFKERARDCQFGSTRKGPHRDDFTMKIDGADARHFASEGQQRALVIALRLAEFSYFQKILNITPLLLADDVLGELDPFRRSNFRKLLPTNAQTFATGTDYPCSKEKSSWETFQVNNGIFLSSSKDIGHG